MAGNESICKHRIEIRMNTKHTRRLNEVCIGVFEPRGMRAVVPLSMTRFDFLPVRSHEALLPTHQGGVCHRVASFGVGTWKGGNVLISGMLPHSARLIEWRPTVSPFDALERDIVAAATSLVGLKRRAIWAIWRGGLIDVGRRGIWGQGLLGILGVGRSVGGRSVGARGTLATGIHGGCG